VGGSELQVLLVRPYQRVCSRGYTQHTQEPGKDFALILDCLEMGKTPPCTWMDQIFILKVLKLYNKDRTAHDFPANMKTNRMSEAFDTRYERIAGLPMAAGSIIAEPALLEKVAGAVVVSNAPARFALLKEAPLLKEVDRAVASLSAPAPRSALEAHTSSQF
jgi:hypothetical protein